MGAKQEPRLPKARCEGLIVQELADEVLVYDQQRDRAYCLNPVAGRVWERCDGRTSVWQAVRELRRTSHARADERLVWMAVQRLHKAGLLSSPLAVPAAARLSRRQAIRRLGLAALPMVAAIVVPPAAGAASCKTNGATCGVNAECCSNRCQGSACCVPLAGSCTSSASCCSPLSCVLNLCA